MSKASGNKLNDVALEPRGESAICLADAREYCRALARTHYENFPIASWLLPRKLHQHFYNIYAFCRMADDLGDEVQGAYRSLVLLQWWRGQLADCYAGSAQHPVFVALQQTVDEFKIPAKPFEDLISAFEQDQRVHEYATFVDLLEYCRRSANPVGELVLHLFGAHDKQNVRWSNSICTGLQLANFWQDVSRDFEMGRVYLPKEDRERFGYSDADLHARTSNRAFFELMRFEVERARDFLLDGRPLASSLRGRYQVDVDLFIGGGLRILRRIEGIRYRVWETRPVVTKRDFAVLFLRSLGRAALRRVLPRGRRASRATDHLAGTRRIL